jgi:predicted metalloendopeptidase
LWSENATKNYDDKSKCFVDQYSSIDVNGEFIDGSVTLDENVADNAGLMCKVIHNHIANIL